MLYNKTLIKDGLFGVVGFQADERTEFADIFNAANLASSSGLYFNEAHAIVNAENIKAIYNEIEEATPYTKLNALIERKVKGSIIKAVDRVFQIKKPDVKSIIDKEVIFKDSLNLSETISNGTKFCAYEIRLKQGQNAKLSLKRIAAAFTETDSITLYLFHDSQEDPVDTISINTTAMAENWQSSDIVIEYDNGTQVGGAWYLGYYQEDLSTNEAIERDCDQHYFYSDCYYIRAVDSVNYIQGKLPDIDNITESIEAHGLNFDIQVEADLTDFMLEIKNEFDKVIQMQFAFDFLEECLYSKRLNHLERVNRDQLIIELKGTDTDKTIGLEYKLRETIQEMNFDLSAFNSTFLPVRKPFKIWDM